jgi:hypothetical protein
LYWTDEELQERVNKLVAAIKAGTKFVSMECLFSDFDYAEEQEDGSYRVIAREEATAYLTKHLRAYGGTGIYEDKKIGRLLKNITFSGKGYVDRPANPDSIIFSQSSVFRVENTDDGVNITIEDNTSDETQSNNREYIMDLEKLQAELETVKQELAVSNEKLAKIDTEKYEVRISELEVEVASAKEKLEASKTEKDEAVASLETVSAELEEVKTAKAELDTQLATAAAEKIVADRIATLIKGGVEEDKATAKVELYKDFSDEQFEAIAEDIIAAVPVKVEAEEAVVEDAVEDTVEETVEDAVATDDNEDEADPEVLEGAEASVDEVVVNIEDESVASVQEATQTKLSHAIAGFLGKTLTK